MAPLLEIDILDKGRLSESVWEHGSDRRKGECGKDTFHPALIVLGADILSILMSLKKGRVFDLKKGHTTHVQM